MASDHDGHTINVGPVTVGIICDRCHGRWEHDTMCPNRPVAEVVRLRAENAALAAAKVQEAGS